MKKVLFVLISVVLFACSKDRVEQHSYQPMDEFYSAYAPQEQVFNVDTGGAGPIIAQQFTEIFVDSSIFMHQDQSDVEYPFQIGYIEIYTKSDMVLGRAPTVSYIEEKPIKSRGEGRIRAYKNGEQLLLRPNKQFLVRFKDYYNTNLSDTYSKFYGGNNDFVTGWSTNYTTTEITPLDSGYFSFFGDSLGWINVDQLQNYSSLSYDLNLIVPGANPENVSKFLIIDGMNSVLMMNESSISLPNGISAKLICFAKNQNEEYIWFEQNLDFSSDQTIELSFNTIDEITLLSNIESL